MISTFCVEFYDGYCEIKVEGNGVVDSNEFTYGTLLLLPTKLLWSGAYGDFIMILGPFNIVFGSYRFLLITTLPPLDSLFLGWFADNVIEEEL